MNSFTEGLDLKTKSRARGVITIEKTYQKKTYSLAKGYHYKRKNIVEIILHNSISSCPGQLLSCTANYFSDGCG